MASCRSTPLWVVPGSIWPNPFNAFWSAGHSMGNHRKPHSKLSMHSRPLPTVGISSLPPLPGVANAPLAGSGLGNVNSHSAVLALVFPDLRATASLCLTYANHHANRPTRHRSHHCSSGYWFGQSVGCLRQSLNPLLSGGIIAPLRFWCSGWLLDVPAVISPKECFQWI